MRRKNYLIQSNGVSFIIMIADSTFWKYLADADVEAEEIFFRLVNEIAHAEGVTEYLKAKDQMAWVGAMNNIRQRATEIVNTEIKFLHNLLSAGYSSEYPAFSVFGVDIFV